MVRTSFRRLVALAAGLASLAGASAAVAPTAAAATVQGAPDALPLHRAGTWMVDSQGRVFVGHGFNIIRKNPPYVRTEFTAADARFLADEGFTTARIGFIWAGAEPKPGVYDEAYIDKVLALDDVLAKSGIRTMVDFHQDAWSVQAGGDGAPAWANLGSTLYDDFGHFWADDPGPGGVGIQTRFVRLWAHVAKKLAAHRNILGLDPFNEPYAGTPWPCAPFTPCPPFEQGQLADFYNRMIKAIRGAGAKQVIFPEDIAFSGDTQPSLPKFADPQTGYHYHYYCNLTQTSTNQTAVGSGSPEAASCAPVEQNALGNYHAYLQSIGVPGFLGEFSCNDVNDDNAQVVDVTDQVFTSWTAWAYYTAADDPADCPDQGLLVNDKVHGSEANAKQAKLDAFAVPHAQAIAGTPRSTNFDRATRTFTLSYDAAPVPGATLARGALTQVFIPARDYPTGYAVNVSGAQVLSGPTAPWLLLRALPGAGTVTLALSPRSGSRTARPLSTGVFPLGGCTRTVRFLLPAGAHLRSVTVGGRRVRARVRGRAVAVRAAGGARVVLTARTRHGSLRRVRRASPCR